MVRRGSTVRVGQKASQESAEKWALSCSDGLAPPRTRFRHGALARFHLDRFGPTVLARIGREVATGRASGELRESPRCSSTASSTPADTTPRASSHWTQDDRGLRIVAHEPLKPLCRYARAISSLFAPSSRIRRQTLPAPGPTIVMTVRGVGYPPIPPAHARARVRAIGRGRRSQRGSPHDQAPSHRASRGGGYRDRVTPTCASRLAARSRGGRVQCAARV